MSVSEFSCFVILFGSLKSESDDGPHCKFFYVIFVEFPSIIYSPLASESKQYRNDYVYNRKTDAFYKLHTEQKRGWVVKYVCEAEGASLLVPTSDYDLSQAHEMFKQYPDLGKYIWIGSDGKNHESAEENPLIELDTTESSFEQRDLLRGCEVMTRDGTIMEYQCFAELPFICKVESNIAPYDSNCGVYGSNYVYYESVGSCYKIPRIVYSWNEAYAECRAQGAHLVVLNSVAEHDAVKNLINSVPKLQDARTSWFFFAGFRADRPVGNATRVFKTIFNQTLEEAGYSTWSPNEPNNYMTREDCGTIFKNDGNFNDVDCTHQYGFICEKERGS